MTHLTPEELIDAVEAQPALAAHHRTHLDACLDCRRQFDELSAVLGDAKQAGIPEPSPLFWDHLSARVNDTIDRGSDSAWPSWIRWQVLLPLGAAAMLILGLMMALPKHDRPAAAIAEESAAPFETPEPASDNWGVVATLVGDLDLDTAAEAGVIEPGVSDRAVLSLTADEQEELTRLLKAELTRAKS